VTASWPLRRVLFWVVVIALIAWVVHNPNHAGNTASNLLRTALGWGESAVSAVITFIGNL